MAGTIGVLLHVYHLEAQNWRELLLGRPKEEVRGSLAALAQLIAKYPNDTQWKILLYSGPSTKNGKNEAENTFDEVINSLDSLYEYSFFAELATHDQENIINVIRSIELSGLIKNTYDEVMHAAQRFTDLGVDTIYQIACASHASRCLQTQLRCREEGHLPKNQLWCVLGSDVCFGSSIVADTIIVEPLHRGDDPLIGFRPGLNEVLKPYFGLDPEAKMDFILKADSLMRNDSQTLEEKTNEGLEV